MKKKVSRNLMWAWGISLIGTICVFLMFFAPFATATVDFEKRIDLYGESFKYDAKTGMSVDDLRNPSLSDLFRVYAFSGKSNMSSAFTVFIIFMFALFAGLNIIFAGLRYGTPVIVHNVMAMLAFLLIQQDFDYRGTFRNGNYMVGPVNYIIYVLGAVVIAAAIWMIVEKEKIKKANQALKENDTAQNDITENDTSKNGVE